MAAKTKKKSAKLRTVIIVVLIIAIVAACVYLYLNGYFDSFLNGLRQNGGGNLDYNNATYDIAAIKNEQLSIHFLELNNGSNGDSIYIKAGETDILIDAGSQQSSSKYISEYVNNYCTDGKLEYVIATHADSDHIAGFVGTKTEPGIFARYECETIIRFTNSSKSLTTSAGNKTLYAQFLDACDAEQSEGANYYTALQCYNQTNGAKREYQLASGITMEVLYQEYYEKTTSNENDYSVCLLIKQDYVEDGERKTNNYLLLGDLEEKGEQSLVNHNPDLPEVVLYKAGHHGSKTSANEVLLNKIKPQIICVCCVAGSIEYTQNLENTFPTQAFINRIAPFTDAVYATDMSVTVYDEAKGRYVDTDDGPLNGNIVFACSNGKVTMYFSNNDTKLKDTEWFKQNRTCPSSWQ